MGALRRGGCRSKGTDCPVGRRHQCIIGAAPTELQLSERNYRLSDTMPNCREYNQQYINGSFPELCDRGDGNLPICKQPVRQGDVGAHEGRQRGPAKRSSMLWSADAATAAAAEQVSSSSEHVRRSFESGLESLKPTHGGALICYAQGEQASEPGRGPTRSDIGAAPNNYLVLVPARHPSGVACGNGNGGVL